MSCGSEFDVHASLSSVEGVLLRSRSARWPIIGEGEVGSDLTHPEVLEFTVRCGDRKLEDMPVAAKPHLANVPEHGIVAHEAHRRGVVREHELHHLVHGHIRQVVLDASGAERPRLVIRRDEKLKPHAYNGNVWLSHDSNYIEIDDVVPKSTCEV